MKRIKKEEVMKLMSALKEKFSHEEIGVMLGRSSMTIWSWGSDKNKRIPSLSDYNVLKHLLAKGD